MSDHALGQMVKVTPNLVHLELQACDNLTDFGIKGILEKLPQLKFIDLSRVACVNHAFVEEIKTIFKFNKTSVL